jgi:hypothetical protein
MLLAGGGEVKNGRIGPGGNSRGVEEYKEAAKGELGP